MPELTLERGGANDREYLDRLDAIDEPTNPSRASFLVRTDTDIEQLPPQTWLVDQIVPKGSLAAIYGAPGSGKSFVALDMALSIGAGIQWLDRRVLAGGALYLAAEGLGGLGQRIKAWKEARGFRGRTIGTGFITTSVDLLEQSNPARVIQAAEGLNKESAPIRLVVIDTLARSMIGDENDTRDMSKLISAVDRIRAATDATVLLVHHTRKDSDVERGSTAIRGGVDTLILCQQTDEGRQLVCQKQKDAEEFAPIAFRLAAGHMSCVVQGLGVGTMAAPADASEKLTGPRVKGLLCLKDSFTSKGATASEWLKASDIQERTFYRVRTWLVAEGYVTEVGNKYRITDSGRYAITRSTATTANRTDNTTANPVAFPPKGGMQGGSGLPSDRNGGSDSGSSEPDFFSSPPPAEDGYADSLAESDERLGMRYEDEP